MNAHQDTLSDALKAFSTTVNPVDAALHHRMFEAVIAAADAENADGDNAAIAILHAAIKVASARLGLRLAHAEAEAEFHPAPGISALTAFD